MGVQEGITDLCCLLSPQLSLGREEREEGWGAGMPLRRASGVSALYAPPVSPEQPLIAADQVFI